MKMYIFIILYCAALFELPMSTSASEAYFWQITDFHYDPSYMTSHDSCNDVIDSKAHPYGDFECDSPWLLVESAIKSIKPLGSTPAFIIWTGDAAPHPKNRSSMSEDILLTILRNTTALIKETFPDVPVYVALGNHDFYPASQLPGHPCRLYNETASDIWRDWLKTDDNVATFARGGFYTTLMPEVGTNVRAVIVNTNLYARKNRITTSDTDPAGQYVWLNNTLNSARRNGEKVHLIMHIPPGILEGTDDARWFSAHTNERFLNILRTYADIMLGIYAGHQHSDSFRIVHDFEGKARASILIAPSVTPWRARLRDGIRTAARNPGVRRIIYDKNTHGLQDVEQFYLSLTDANDPDNIRAGLKPQWKFLYSFKRSYGVQDMSAQSLNTLTTDFKMYASDKFHRYYTWNSVDARQPSNIPCDCTCKHMHVCSIEWIDYTQNIDCLKQAPCSATTSKQHTSVVLLLSLTEAVVLKSFLAFSS